MAKRPSGSGGARTRKKGFRLDWKMAGAIAALLIVIGVIISSVLNSHSHDWIKFSDNGFTTTEKNDVTRALTDWANAYQGCPVTVVVSTSTEAAMTESGNYIDADSSSGEITFYLPNIRRGTRPLYEVALHEAMHACQNPTVIETQFFVDHPMTVDDLTIIGTQGLKLVARRANGHQTYYSLCEEGVAEWAAANVFHAYRSYHPGYANLFDYFNETFGTKEQTIRPVLLAKAGDVFGFIRDTQHVQNVTTDNVSAMIETCNSVANRPRADYPYPR